MDPVSIAMVGMAIYGIFKNRGPSQAEKSAAFEAAMQQQAELYDLKEMMINAVLPAIAIIGGIMLLREK